jgi:D-xylose transport system permease protein
MSDGNDHADDTPDVAPGAGRSAARQSEELLREGEAADTVVAQLTAYTKAWWVRVKAGELGSLPLMIGLIIILVVFGIAEDVFFTPRNFTNLLLQMSGIATIAIGIVFVLLIAEIDLSVAYVSAVGGVVMTLLLRPDDPGWPWFLAIAAALIITTLIGMVTGLIVTKAGVPSFVVSLAGLLVYSGVVLTLTTEASNSGTVRIQDETVIDIAGSFLSDTMGWILGLGTVAVFAAIQLRTAWSRRARNLTTKPIALIVLQILGMLGVVGWGVWYANRDRGVPFVLVIVLVLLVFWSFVAARTAFGRHIYAVGGSPEAARRAGINVDRIKIAVFMIMGFMAGVGGIILASRIRSVATGTGGGNLLLEVIAAAVIGGTSLFGGRGRPVNALLGALVIASVSNGMDLLGLAAGTKFIVTGLVLLAAVLVDSLSKKGRASAGIV